MPASACRPAVVVLADTSGLPFLICRYPSRRRLRAGADDIGPDLKWLHFDIQDIAVYRPTTVALNDSLTILQREFKSGSNAILLTSDYSPNTDS